jgi:hypothetical protein
MSKFRIGDKVLYTGNEEPSLNDYGQVVDFTTHHDGSTSPIVRFNGDKEDSYPVCKYLEVVESFPTKEKKKQGYLSNQEVIKRLLKSKANTVFTTPEQVENTLKILKRMGVLNTVEGIK